MEENLLMHAETAENHGIISQTDLADVGLVDETVIEAIWSDLDGRVDRERVREVALTVAQDFVDVTVTSFVPLFIRRRTYERLKTLID